MTILKVLSFVQSKAVEYSETYAAQFFIGENSKVSVDPAEHTSWKIGQLMKLKDQTNPSTFFMHEHDDKGQVIRWFGNTIFE